MPITDNKLYNAISGIGKGAAIGAAAMGNPLLLPAAFGADKAAKKNIIRSPIKPIKQSRELLAADVNMMRTDPAKLGLSDAEKERMRAEAVQTASAQNQAQASQLAQAALAGQGFQAGQFEQAQQNLGQSAAEAGAKAGAQINELSNRIAERKKADIMSRLDAERERAKENTRFWLDFGIKGVGAIVAAAMGAPSPLQGLSMPSGGGGGGQGGGTTINLGGGSRDLAPGSDTADALAQAEDVVNMTGYR